MHDDGTYAIYAHLNTNTIRVRPGDRVRRGQYIADSGNTGFFERAAFAFRGATKRGHAR